MRDESAADRMETAYELSERASGALIYFLIVFTPWAFGATEDWSMRVANAAGYALGLLLLTKHFIRWRKDLAFEQRGKSYKGENKNTPERLLIGALSLLTFAFLACVFISAVNARAAYDWASNTFSYFDCIDWLPHSYDAGSTWPAFANYLAWAAVFWSVRDWLLSGQSNAASVRRSAGSTVRDTAGARIRRATENPRLRRLLWVLAVNGGLLSFEALIQHTTGTDKLLGIRETFYNRSADAQFGPYPYRANGAQYLNLVWPVALGLWWSLQRTHRPGTPSTHHLLLACVMMMIIGPVTSLSRGAAGITVAAVGLCVLVLAAGRVKESSLPEKLAIMAVLLVGIAEGLGIGWPKLADRLKSVEDSYLAREKMYEIGRRMAADNPLFGAGADTFQPLYQFYKGSPEEYWPGQLHNDWLETRITLGSAGLSMILTALAAVLGRWMAGGGLKAGWRFVAFFWIALTGCLVHARWDLPFQVYSIVLPFVVFCSVLSCLSRSRSAAPRRVRESSGEVAAFVRSSRVRKK